MLHKAINQLSFMESMIANIFTADDLQVVKDSQIHISRLENLVAMMKCIREDIIKIEHQNTTSKGILDIAAKYDSRFEQFVKKYNNVLNQELEWVASHQ